MSKAGNVAATATIFALALTNPTVRRTTAKLLRKAAKFLDDSRPLPVSPPPMWGGTTELDSEEHKPKSRTKKMTLEEYSKRNSPQPVEETAEL